MKTAAIFAFLLLGPLAFGQNPPAPEPVRVETVPAVAQSEALTKTQEEVTKPAAIRKLFEIQGTRQSMGQVLAGMSANMKPMLSKMLAPGDYQDKWIPLFFEKFQSKMKADDLIEMRIPVYDKYLSKEDIDGLAQFYQTPVGKKMLSVLPQLAVETQAAAMNMGQELGRKAMLEVLAEHPDLEKAMEEAGARKN